MRELTLETNLNGNITKLFANMTRIWSCMTFSGVLCRPRIITGHHGPGTGGLLSQTMTSLKKKKSEKKTRPLTTNSRLQLIKRQRRQLRAIETPTIFAEFLFTCILTVLGSSVKEFRNINSFSVSNWLLHWSAKHSNLGKIKGCFGQSYNRWQN